MSGDTCRLVSSRFVSFEDLSDGVERWDLATKVAQEDVNLFRDEFDVLSIEELTGPDVECKFDGF
jgi:hypothetical protein